MTTLAPQTVDKTHHMKKILTLISAVVLIAGFTACGQSEEERKADSLQQDSVEKEADATADMLIEQMERQNDSMYKADSIAAVKDDSARKADSAAGKK